MNKIFAFPLYATVDTSFGTDLELIQLHLDKGDMVKVFTCPEALKACDRNILHQIDECNRCIKKSARGLSLLHPLNSNLIIQKITQLPEWDQEISVDFLDLIYNIEDFKNISFDIFDLGYSILSSLISWSQDYCPDIKDNITLLKKLADSSLRLYLCVDILLQKEKPDIVYVFNGRYAPMRAIVRACQKNSVKVFTHDRGCNLYHYSTFQNTLPHDIDLFLQSLWSGWNKANPIKRVKIAKQWFEDRSKGKNVDAWISFTREQNVDLLPLDWNRERRNISIFTSSEHEFASIGQEWEGRLFKNQASGIDFIIDSLKSEINQGYTNIYLRIHPNQANASAKEINELLSFEERGLIILEPKSIVSSYKLMKESDLVITFGSTVGIEATYWGTPSILLGQSFYKKLNATYNPTNLYELKGLLKEGLKPKPSSLALPYAYYQATFGQPYKYYEPTGLLTGKFKGYHLEKHNKYHTILLKIKNRLMRLIDKFD
jgi:hypothetical protein